jgi:orotidine-5'-phosphate decarboxylase
MQPHERIIVALDVPTLDAAKCHAEALAPYVGSFKIGLELISAVGGPAAVAAVRDVGGGIMHDTKLNDIPNTLAGATRSVSGLGVEMFTVMASSGADGMKAVVGAKGTSLALAVTVLTSMSEQDCLHVFGTSVKERVRGFALDAAFAGMDGIVCSPADLALFDPSNGPVVWMRADPPSAGNYFDVVRPLTKVTPGVRPAWAAAGDQKRVMTPAEAVLAGADYLVIGRPILKPPPEIGSSVEAAKRIAAEIAEALAKAGQP